MMFIPFILLRPPSSSFLNFSSVPPPSFPGRPQQIVEAPAKARINDAGKDFGSGDHAGEEAGGRGKAARGARRRRAASCDFSYDGSDFSELRLLEGFGNYVERPLFGGAISCIFPLRFEDVSNIREVPDQQEVFVDPARDESLIFELLEYKHEVADNGSANWFLQDLASEQDADGGTVIEQSGIVDAPGLSYKNIPSVVTNAVGQMAISKGRQGKEAQNIVRVYLANLRLKGVDTDILITAYEPLVINPLSESAISVGPGVATPAAQTGLTPVSEVFKLAVSSFKVNDWSLFGESAV
ncbi:hypothetical protein V2J09_016157 [Rumex salicifolius]